MNYDITRLTNGISGWDDRKVGHFIDLHQYPGPGMEPPSQNEGRAVVLGEFGGYGYPVKNHLWNETNKNWGYRVSKNIESYLKDYNDDEEFDLTYNEITNFQKLTLIVREEFSNFKKE